MTVYNYTDEEITFIFKDAQRFDLIIEDQEGRQVWKWSEGKFFAQVLGEEILGPENPTRIFKAKFNGALEPGIYKVKGIWVAKEKSLSSEISIIVLE